MGSWAWKYSTVTTPVGTRNVSVSDAMLAHLAKLKDSTDLTIDDAKLTDHGLGHEGAGYHLEFTTKRGHVSGPAPSQEHMLVFYLPDAATWCDAVMIVESLGLSPVTSFNPYWDRNGRTYEDPDGYRVVYTERGLVDWLGRDNDDTTERTDARKSSNVSYAMADQFL